MLSRNFYFRLLFWLCYSLAATKEKLSVVDLIVFLNMLVNVFGFCAQSNPENTVGVLTMAGKGVRVLVTPTSDLGKILACMHG